jgi:hypothetical protein
MSGSVASQADLSGEPMFQGFKVSGFKVSGYQNFERLEAKLETLKPAF